MLVLPTAKVLLFIALQVGPHQPSEIYATSNSESYVWSTTQTGWALEAKGFPASDFTRDPTKNETFGENSTASSVPAFLLPVAHHNWSRNSAMVFNNGDRVEKHGDHAFYIVNAGGANEKVFTIFFPQK